MKTDIKDLLLDQYNQGLKHGEQNVHQGDFTQEYERLIKIQQNTINVSITTEFRKKWMLEAFKAGLQDGYHWNGESSFDEWFKVDYRGRYFTKKRKPKR